MAPQNFDIESVKLEGLRTLIIYDSPYAARSLIFYHILPRFESKNLFIAVFSDTMYRRLEKTYESIAKTSQEIAKVLENAKIIKIGLKEKVSFGKLYKLINPDLWSKGLADVVKNLGKDDILIFHGFSIIPAIYGQKAIMNLLRILDLMPEDVTLISKLPRIYEESMINLLERFYDVVINIERSGEETYIIGVSQSIIMDIKPGFGWFRIGEDGKLIECYSKKKT